MTSYVLYANDGGLNDDNFTPVTSYDGQTMKTFTVDINVEPNGRFSTGTIYKFKVSAVNRIGEGALSN